MRLFSFIVFFCVLFFGCDSEIPRLNSWEPYDETKELIANADHPIKRMQYKRIQSQHIDRNSFFSLGQWVFKNRLPYFSSFGQWYF